MSSEDNGGTSVSTRNNLRILFFLAYRLKVVLTSGGRHLGSHLRGQTPQSCSETSRYTSRIPLQFASIVNFSSTVRRAPRP